MAEMYKAYLKGVRIAPRKIRLVADLIRGKSVAEALDILTFTYKRSAPVLKKMVEAAVANAKNRATIDVDRLYVKEAFVDGAMMLKRFIPRAQGRAAPIRKRTSHITVKVVER